MLLQRLTLSNFRNYSELDLEPTAGLNVFVGANAQGKSNLLEGIAMLGTGKSFRTSRESDTVRADCDRAVLHGRAALNAGAVELVCAIERSSRGTRKTYTVNGGGVRYASYLGRMRVVTFVPADLSLASGTPSGRRAFLNIALSQTEPRYYYELARYRNALQQKNALLRGAIEPDAELLETYGRTLVEAGTQIVLARDRIIRAIAQNARRAHARFAGSEQLDVRYEPNVPFPAAEDDAVAAALEARMRHCADMERLRKAAIAGPHRDDMSLTLDGVSLSAYGSQGQQRTAVLALKIAEYTVMHERSSEAPLLLLDDVLSELDEGRATAFLEEIGEFEQAFITATHLPVGLPSTATLSRVSGAQVLAGVAC
ncbi:MAG TPA: DNA replication/repair protein RecF [Candidatus Dormibacteraeota bacterium]|nr:DNA replication/repair protein RecF [Candidatus Dormibacteraeota bacterium]